MLNKVKSFIETENLLTESATVVVGLSGGADSVVLVHILKQLNYRCIAAHCNFHLRIEESNRDELFVRKFCNTNNIELYTIDFDTISHSKSHKISIEMAARELRYKWFEEIRKKTGAEAIAVAHHADDNAETLLLNLVRGTGIRGLTGISPKNGNIIRPLLCVGRNEVEKYTQTMSLEFVTDSTNQQNEYQNNKKINIILPLISDINPLVNKTLNENAKRFESIFRIYQQYIQEKQNLIVRKTENEVYINIDLLKQEPEINTLLYEICRDYGFHPDQINGIIQSLDSISGKKWHSTTHTLLKDRKYLIIKELEKYFFCEVEVYSDTDELFEPMHLNFRHFIKHPDYKISRNPFCVHIDAGFLKFPLLIRKFTVCDSFIPFGMKGRNKLSDFFSDQKLTAYQKENIYVLTSDNNIVWIIGYRIDNRFAINDNTTEILEIQVE